MAGIARLFPIRAGPSGFGRNSELWSFATRRGWRRTKKPPRRRSARAAQLAERLFEGDGEALREEFRRAVGGDHHVVFAAQAKLSGDINPRLIGKSHARFQGGFAAADEIRVLGAVEADAVAETVGEEFVVRAVAGVGDDRTRGVVDGAGKAAGARGVQGCVLRLAHDFEGLRDLIAGFAEDAGARNV